MIAKLRLVFTITIVFLSFSGIAQTAYWKNTELNNKAKQFTKQQLRVNKGTAFTLNQQQFLQALSEHKTSNIIYFPDTKIKIDYYVRLYKVLLSYKYIEKEWIINNL